MKIANAEYGDTEEECAEERKRTQRVGLTTKAQRGGPANKWTRCQRVDECLVRLALGLGGPRNPRRKTRFPTIVVQRIGLTTKTLRTQSFGFLQSLFGLGRSHVEPTEWTRARE